MINKRSNKRSHNSKLLTKRNKIENRINRMTREEAAKLIFYCKKMFNRYCEILKEYSLEREDMTINGKKPSKEWLRKRGYIIKKSNQCNYYSSIAKSCFGINVGKIDSCTDRYLFRDIGALSYRQIINRRRKELLDIDYSLVYNEYDK